MGLGGCVAFLSQSKMKNILRNAISFFHSYVNLTSLHAYKAFQNNLVQWKMSEMR